MAHIPNDLLKCVVFLGYRDEHEQYHFTGSGFWISRPGPSDIRDVYRPAYLATAAHVIATIKKESADGRVWMRVNTKQGVQEWRETPLQCWATHPDDSVDIAVLKIGIDEAFDHVAWPMEACVTDDSLDTVDTGDRKVELGDELCFAGLFWPHTGDKKNIPIVRIGTVAALRNEPVVNRDGLPMDAYLVESRSVGGVSGSPVFIDIITAKTILPPTSGYMAGAYNPQSKARLKLFGVVHGHFGDDLEPDAVADDGKEKLHVNMGIAMVIPAEKIIEVLDRFTKEEEIEISEAREKKRSLTAQHTVRVRVGEANSNVTFQIATTGTEALKG